MSSYLGRAGWADLIGMQVKSAVCLAGGSNNHFQHFRWVGEACRRVVWALAQRLATLGRRLLLQLHRRMESGAR